MQHHFIFKLTFYVFSTTVQFVRETVQQCSHYILVLKFEDFSRTFEDPKLHFQGQILHESLQHGQYYSNIQYLFLWLRDSFSW